MKKLFFALGILGVLGGAHGAFASSLIISEIMYDVPGTDAGYEWVEVHNTSDAAIDMANWRFLENDVRHALSLEAGPSSMVMPGEYAVIASNSANFLSAHVGFVGTLFDSVFSLNNTGESLALISADDTTEDTVFYTPQDAANGTGNSLQYVGGSWVAAGETPGLASHTTPAPDTTDTSGSGSSSSGGSVSNSSSSSAKPKENFKPYYTMTLDVPDVMLAGVAFELDADLKHFRPNRKPMTRHSGRFSWSMGDGATYDQEWEEPLEHQYQYPGEYIVYIEYFKSDLFQEPNSTVQKKITVHGPDITIAEITDSGDIRLESTSDFIFDLSGWLLRYQDQEFVFPHNTFLPPRESRYIHPGIHHMASLGPYSAARLALVRPSGEEHVAVIPRDLVTARNTPEEKEIDGAEGSESGLEHTSETLHVHHQEHEEISEQKEEAPGVLLWALLGVGTLSSLVTLGGLWMLRREKEEVTEREKDRGAGEEGE